ncbi:Rrf2 family transcriptional regulator [Agrobacterium vitis]|uniref:RrF2 family transcriptional regulator n=1 Tax=Rhizobium/Agrobacterium group TaxID=227290 RepID=UPI000871C7B3|nr:MULTISPECIES: Rrf2 family transcriptional regulator [Rhizobium/Agrobacterium group]MCF1449308.1 Rrf2 family transcriptional regulator [Allorhizobium ampelinum]MCF1464175.1 Rrf2 family transcriptional regulator [Allorhizobium ampelinum]MCF1484848.1 Rrf2 family transcriptional regulator [Allorhizobium ampelinum]MUO71976.1 Rrf2 family transcriptional regulator [Agrobacterium vitis]
MQLTAFSDYSLRLMMMATAHSDRLVTIEETARAFDISRAHLMKVAHHLVRQGFLKTVRGRTGGLTLARPPEMIGLGEIIRATERDFALVECFGVSNQCRITPRCRLRGVLADALDAFMAVLDRHTLRDLVRNPQDFGLPSIK